MIDTIKMESSEPNLIYYDPLMDSIVEVHLLDERVCYYTRVYDAVGALKDQHGSYLIRTGVLALGIVPSMWELIDVQDLLIR